MRQPQILAGAVREIEMDLRIPLYLSDTSPLTRRGVRCGGVTIAAAVGVNIGIRNPVLSLIATSIFRAVICVRAEIARISVGMFGLYRTFFICADGKKTAFVRA